MVPSAFVLLDQLPMTPSGKIDRLRLPPVDAALRSPHAHAPPRSALEKLIASIWEDVLGTEPVGLHEDFFKDLGGHSLLGTQVVARVREALNVQLPLRRLFDAPTVDALSDALLEDAANASQIEQTATIVLEVIGMPDDEVDRMLADRDLAAQADGPRPQAAGRAAERSRS